MWGDRQDMHLQVDESDKITVTVIHIPCGITPKIGQYSMSVKEGGENGKEMKC